MSITSVSIDLRNFTTMFNGLLNLKVSRRHSYLSIIQEYIQICINQAKLVGLENEIDFITTGDGVIVIFNDRDNNLRGYIYTLIIYKSLTDFFNSVKMSHPTDPRLKNIDFGVGIDSGKAEVLYLTDGLKNHLSDAINISSRLEGLSKTFIGSKVIISSSALWPIIDLLYSDLFVENYNVKNYEGIINHSRSLENSNNRDGSKEIWNLMNNVNESIFFRYLSSVSIKGLSEPKIIYRLSKTLYKMKVHKFHEEFEPLLSKIFQSKYALIKDLMLKDLK